jgi:hypothetical protein
MYNLVTIYDHEIMTLLFYLSEEVAFLFAYTHRGVEAEFCRS